MSITTLSIAGMLDAAQAGGVGLHWQETTSHVIPGL